MENLPKKETDTKAPRAKASLAKVLAVAAIMVPSSISKSSAGMRAEKASEVPTETNEQFGPSSEEEPALVSQDTLKKRMVDTPAHDTVQYKEKRSIDTVRADIERAFVAPGPEESPAKPAAAEPAKPKAETREAIKPVVMDFETYKATLRKMIESALAEDEGEAKLGRLDLVQSGDHFSFSALIKAPAAFGMTLDIGVTGTIGDVDGFLGVKESVVKTRAFQKKAEAKILPKLATIGRGFAKFVSEHNDGKKIKSITRKAEGVIVEFEQKQ